MNNTNNMIDVTHGLSIENSPRHFIVFGSDPAKSDEARRFDSRRFNLNLHERIGNTPSEKEVTTSIPYMQGIVDMSNAIGNRIYENREITYVFYRFGVSRGHARDFQTTITNLLMGQFDARLDDSFEPDFHYFGKCQQVNVSDDYDRHRLRVEITFDLYPFKRDNHGEAEDLFDPFNFDLDAFQDGLVFEVSGEQNIQLYNASQLTLRPAIRASQSGLYLGVNDMKVQLASHPTDAYTYPNIRLKPGMNDFSLTGSGTVMFNWRKERI